MFAAAAIFHSRNDNRLSMNPYGRFRYFVVHQALLVNHFLDGHLPSNANVVACATVHYPCCQRYQQHARQKWLEMHIV